MTTSPDWPSKMAIQSLAHDLGQTRVPAQARSLDLLFETIKPHHTFIPIFLFHYYFLISLLFSALGYPHDNNDN
jgi:hypothetical protein